MPRIVYTAPSLSHERERNPAEALSHVLAKEQDVRQSSRLYMEALNALESLRQELENDPNYAQYPQRLRELWANWRAEHLPGLSAEGRARIEQKLEALERVTQASVLSLSETRQVESSRQELQEDIERLLKRLATEPPSPYLILQVQELDERIGEHLEQGILSPEQAQSISMRLRRAVSLADARTVAVGEPKAVLEGRLRFQELDEQGSQEVARAAKAALASRRGKTMSALRRVRTSVKRDLQPDAALEQAHFEELYGEDGQQAFSEHQAQLRAADERGALLWSSESELRDLSLQLGTQVDGAIKRRAARDIKIQRLKDPAGFLASANGYARQLTDRLSADASASAMAEAIDLLVREQRRMGMAVEHCYALPQAEVRKLAERLATGDAGATIDYLVQLAEEVDDSLAFLSFLSQLRQGGLPIAVEAALLSALRGNRLGAVRALARLRADETSPDVFHRDESSTSLSDGDLPAVRALQFEWLQDALSFDLVDEEEELLSRLARLYSKGGQGRPSYRLAFQDLVGPVKPFADPALAAVLHPVRFSAAQFADGMRALRSEIGQETERRLVPVTSSRAAVDISARDFEQQARWVDWLSGYALVLPGQGKVSDRDGDVRRFSAEEIAAAASGEGAGYDS